MWQVICEIFIQFRHIIITVYVQVLTNSITLEAVFTQQLYDSMAFIIHSFSFKTKWSHTSKEREKIVKLAYIYYHTADQTFQQKKNILIMWHCTRY